ncbi:unnamed protein product [Peronospora belbahrii]|uniref:PWWP domain-containing protein n=1 Tax=Peronospora belbahrii TaxID=622444 RepID=A0ABN8CWE2_9STRA|nr:unnamed protein product [Peronospora belbahrii]
MNPVQRRPRKGSAIKPQCILEKNDWLDVLDADGVWNVARVLSVVSPKKVKITYDGWPKDYDEVVSINSNRVAPYHTYTWTVKCWVKYLNWPLWPSLITIRTPGTKAGITNLASENRLFVDFFDKPKFTKRDRCWQKKTRVQAFDEKFDTKRTGSTGASFERALGWMLQSTASTTMPKFAVGTLPVEYKHSPAKSVETVRKEIDDEQWFRRFMHSKMRHQMNHVYETTGFNDGKGSTDKTPCVGRTKLTAKQRLSSAGEIVGANVDQSADNDEVDAAQSVVNLAQLDIAPDRSGSGNSTKRSKKNGVNSDSGPSSFKSGASKMLSMQSEAIIDRQSGDTKKKKIGMGPRQQLVARKGARHERAGQSGCSLLLETTGISRKRITDGSIAGADSRDSAGANSYVGKHFSTLLGAGKRRRIHDDGCSQELRRRFCVMQADQEDADATETVKCSKKTIISVPRKFNEVSVPQIPTCFTDSLVGMARPPQLRTFASSVQTNTALAAPSTAVFSSSNNFSMESWFKRRLMTDFMGGGM